MFFFSTHEYLTRLESLTPIRVVPISELLQ